jgi:hypothetical protein
MNAKEQKQESPPFTFAIRPDKYGRGDVAFIQWHSAKGESSCAGTLRGFAQREVLKAAAKACVEALNGGDIGHWADDEDREGAE